MTVSLANLAPSIVGALLSIVLMLVAGVRRTGPGWRYMIALGVAVALWCIGQTLWLLTGTVETALRVNQVQYLAITMAPVLWFWLALAQTGRSSWLRWRFRLPFLVLPAFIIVVGLGYVDDGSNILWRGIQMPPEVPVPRVVYGPLFYVMAAYSYTLFVGGCLLMFFHFEQSPHYRVQRNITAIIPVAVLVLNATFITGNWPLATDPTPLGFALSFSLLLWALGRHRLFDISPVGRSEAFDSLADGVLILDLIDRVADINRAACHLLHCEAVETLGRRFDAVLPGVSVASVLADPVEVVVPGPAGKPLCLHVAARHITGDSGTTIGALLTLRDVTEERAASAILHETRQRLEQANLDLERMAHTDMLTGLANRRLLIARLELECSRSRRHAMPLSLLMIDLDQFKAVNDLRGHLTGDMVLRQVGATLRAVARPEDIPARYGGEEMAMLLTDTDLDGASALALRVLKVLRELVHHDAATGEAFNVTCSIGLATLSGEDTTADALIARADAALYAAKAAGRNCVIRNHDGAMLPILP
jgi:diguanylate cyclase (GGDEF)-like protein